MLNTCGPDHYKMSIVYESLGYTCAKLGQMERSIECFRKSESIKRIYDSVEKLRVKHGEYLESVQCGQPLQDSTVPLLEALVPVSQVLVAKKWISGFGCKSAVPYQTWLDEFAICLGIHIPQQYRIRSFLRYLIGMVWHEKAESCSRT